MTVLRMYDIKHLSTCIEPSPMPPAIRFPSRSQAQVVTGTRPGLESLGLITC